MGARTDKQWRYSVLFDHLKTEHIPTFPGSFEVTTEGRAEIEATEGKPGRPILGFMTSQGTLGLLTGLKNDKGEELTAGDVLAYHGRVEAWTAANTGPHQILYPERWVDAHFAQFTLKADMKRFLTKWGGSIRQPSAAQRAACKTAKEIEFMYTKNPRATSNETHHTVIIDQGTQKPTSH